MRKLANLPALLAAAVLVSVPIADMGLMASGRGGIGGVTTPLRETLPPVIYDMSTNPELYRIRQRATTTPPATAAPDNTGCIPIYARCR